MLQVDIKEEYGVDSRTMAERRIYPEAIFLSVAVLVHRWRGMLDTCSSPRGMDSLFGKTTWLILLWKNLFTISEVIFF